IRICPIAIEQVLYFLKHGFDVPKGAVDTGKTDIGDLIQVAQPLHDHLSNDTALYFFSAEAVELLLNLLDSILDFTDWEGTLFTCFAQPDREFFPIKWLTSLITFDHHQMELLNPFVGAETTFALFTFTPSVNSI